MSHDEQIRNVRQKLQLLVKKYQQLQQENASLRELNEELKGKADKQHLTIENLSHKNTVANIQLSELDPEEKAAIKKKIDFYLKEIDKCIAAINVK